MRRKPFHSSQVHLSDCQSANQQLLKLSISASWLQPTETVNNRYVQLREHEAHAATAEIARDADDVHFSVDER